MFAISTNLFGNVTQCSRDLRTGALFLANAHLAGHPAKIHILAVCLKGSSPSESSCHSCMRQRNRWCFSSLQFYGRWQRVARQEAPVTVGDFPSE